MIRVFNEGTVVAATADVVLNENAHRGEAVILHAGIAHRLFAPQPDALKTYGEPHRVFQTLRGGDLGNADGEWTVDTLGRPLSRWKLTLIVRNPP